MSNWLRLANLDQRKKRDALAVFSFVGVFIALKYGCF